LQDVVILLVDCVRYFEGPQMLPERVTILTLNRACLLNIKPLAFVLLSQSGACLLQVKVLVVFRCDIADLTPLALRIVSSALRRVNGRDSESVGRPGHQIRDDALVRFPLVYLSELLDCIHFHTDSVLQNVFQGGWQLRFGDVVRVTPRDLDCCRSLSDVAE